MEKIYIWHDLKPRCGAENMAVDEALLLRGADCPIVRFYRWAEPTISFGYFDKIETAKEAYPDKNLFFVRRWTGGGIVDHRRDQPVSIVVPSENNEFGKLRNSELYEKIHQALVKGLQAAGVHEARLVSEDLGHGRLCFANPVASDIVGDSGRKLAGAGMRRTRGGILYQGSVQLGEKFASLDWQSHFVKNLAQEWFPLEFPAENSASAQDKPCQPNSCQRFAGFAHFAKKVCELTEQKYLMPEWVFGRRRA